MKYWMREVSYSVAYIVKDEWWIRMQSSENSMFREGKKKRTKGMTVMEKAIVSVLYSLGVRWANVEWSLCLSKAKRIIVFMLYSLDVKSKNTECSLCLKDNFFGYVSVLLAKRSLGCEKAS